MRRGDDEEACLGGQHPRCGRGTRRGTSFPQSDKWSIGHQRAARGFSARKTFGCGPLSVTEGTRPSQPGTLLKQHIGEGPPGSYRLLCRRDPVCALSRNSVFESESRRHLLGGAPGTRRTESETPGVGHVSTGGDGQKVEKVEASYSASESSEDED